MTPDKTPGQGQKTPPVSPQEPAGAPTGKGRKDVGEQLLINVTDQIFAHATEAIMESLEASDDLAMTMGQMAAEILKSQLDAMNAVGKNLPQEVYLDAGAEIVKNLTELASAMGLVSAESPEEVDMLQSEALNNASQIFVQMAPEYVDGEALQQFAVDAAGGKFDQEQENGPTG